MFDSLVTIHYTLSMRRGDRYIGIGEDGQRYWRSLLCGHPVPNYTTKRCRDCWFASDDRKEAVTKERNYTIRGESHHSWKGGRIVNTGGYIEVRVGDKYVPEHRLVMEAYLGRKLKRTEEVHHINYKKTDNRIENLMLFSSHADHIKYEHETGGRKNGL